MEGEEAEGEAEMGPENTRWLASSQRPRLADERLWTQHLIRAYRAAGIGRRFGLYLYSVLIIMVLSDSSVEFEDSQSHLISALIQCFLPQLSLPNRGCDDSLNV
jgi:hypothetical protein